MTRRKMIAGMGAAAALLQGADRAEAQGGGTGSETVYELREYHTNPGKLPELEARFRDHTIAIFKRHGIESVAYWTPEDEPLKGNALIYIIRHPSREAAKANWAAFQADPEWQKVNAESNANGKLVDHIESTFMKLTEWSPRV